MNKYIIAFDVGGSYIKSTVLNNQGMVIPDSYKTFPARADESKEVIIDHLTFVILEQLKDLSTKDFQLKGIGFAFPGPFDYKNGISYIQGIDKFDSLYAVNVRYELMRRIRQEEFICSKLTDDFSIVFENDANLFALGEARSGKGVSFHKAIYLTIGTGAGSAFIESGNLVKNDSRVPENGWIYKESFESSIVDDYISKRGVLKLAQDLSIAIKDKEVKTLADMARNQHIGANEVFHQFGLNIGKALNPHVHAFAPEAIIIGGQIAKSIHLFIDGIYETLTSKEVVIEASNNTSISTFVGVAALINRPVISIGR